MPYEMDVHDDLRRLGWSWGALGRWSVHIANYTRRLARRYFFIILALVFIMMLIMTKACCRSSLGVSQLNPAGASFQMPLAPVTSTMAPIEIVEVKPDPKVPIDNSSEKPSCSNSDKVTGGPEYCTTWPVDSEGNYTPKPKPIRALQLDSIAPKGGWKKPEGFKVVAMVFYGRKRNVDILDCYLRQNLVSYGGYLDEVWFMVHTLNEDDIHWLRGFVNEEPEYKYFDLGPCAGEKYGCIWEFAVEKDTMYIKIDDDILYIHHDAIPQLVHTRLAQPHPYAVSAQLVNSPVTGLQQYHYGAIHPFLPDPYHGTHRKAAEAWRPSELGLYPEAMLPLSGDLINVNSSYRGHRWLLLSNSSHDTVELTRTPMGAWNRNQGSEQIAFGPAWKSWAIAAQQLYSLLYNLERNQMHRYHFGRALNFEDAVYRKKPNNNTTDAAGEGTVQTHHHYYYSGPGGEQLYDMQYERYNLNFFAIWGRDVAAGLPIREDDEAELTSEIPLRLRRPVVIDTRAVVAHQSFYTQREGINQTDLVDRFRAFANENVCAADNLKKPWDGRCEGF
ncbi:hypothetical protein F4776DRAFT_671595 [Hypoxylon sp. NC0597]|nr:hypothetical protein F4776DRAFT_671595 [Hypoxylon sp. NC0597]